MTWWIQQTATANNLNLSNQRQQFLYQQNQAIMYLKPLIWWTGQMEKLHVHLYRSKKSENIRSIKLFRWKFSTPASRIMKMKTVMYACNRDTEYHMAISTPSTNTWLFFRHCLWKEMDTTETNWRRLGTILKTLTTWMDRDRFNVRFLASYWRYKERRVQHRTIQNVISEMAVVVAKASRTR